MADVRQPARDRYQGGRDPVAVARQLAADYQAVFATPSGQRVLADLLARTGVLMGTYRDGAPGMEFREGQRAAGLYVIRQLNETPDSLARFAVSGKTQEFFPDE